MGHSEASSSSPPPLSGSLRFRLSVMMFFQFAVWGSWFVVLGNYAKAMGFSDTDIGSIFATMSLGAVLSPIFIGQIADRYFASERLLAVLHLAGAGMLYVLAQITDASTFYWAALGYALVYSPTLALSNSVAFTHLPDAARDFPGIRVFGTIGWIFAGLLVTLILQLFADQLEVADLPAPKFSMLLNGVRFTLPLAVAAVLSLVLGVWSLFLPHTPPRGQAGDALPFLRALGLVKEPSFAVFYGVSFIITIALAFYYAWTGPYLETAQQVTEKNVSSIMAIGQVTEMILLPLLPLFLRRLGMKGVLAVGMLAWGVRYGLFALGTPFVLVLLGIALHGICFDFFFAAGFIHVDNKAPRDIRASAQALFSFLTYGAGMYLGSTLSGHVAAWCSTDATTDWTSFWTVPAIGVLVSFALFVICFRERIREA